ncbi:short chain dehydrogenase [Neolentinus lepideus HHB14362 ss-1]|uniref:Short chain dehydrogenase n=1 Tax=Neolentinus lepideus HHB14362 ss-1 TaxID=1314782 RepID=A0A165VEY4_9AGAM|nr:short chain dehydrogenase [Neolentinus lepideus HHB14362 ss-1]
MSDTLVWLITGTSSGIGRELVLAALSRGEHVIATARARSIHTLTPLKELGAAILELDVTAPLEKLESIASEAVKIYGRVDVLVNNAGVYNAPGPVENLTPEDTVNQFHANLFGPLNVSRAFLPYMRERRSGTVAWIGSIGSYIHIPNCGVYCATKAAMISISEALNAELEPFNVRSICFNCGWYRTELVQPSKAPPLKHRILAYKESAEKWYAYLRGIHQKQLGDPAKAAEVVVQVVRGEGVAAGKQIPSKLALGSDAYGVIGESYLGSLAKLEEWKEVTRSTDY